MHCACGVNDTAFILKKFEFIYEKALAPQGPRTDVLMRKKPRNENLVTLYL
jgi:hypothetical protein